MADTRLPFPLAGTDLLPQSQAGITGPYEPVLPGPVGTEMTGVAVHPSVDVVLSQRPRAFVIDYQWFLNALGTPIVTGPRFERFKKAVWFFAGSGLEPETIVKKLKGIDFSSVKLPVEPVTLMRGETLIQWIQGELGSWFTRSRVLPEALGISAGGPFRNKRGDVVDATRIAYYCRVKKSCPALRSRSAGTNDFWTRGRKEQFRAGGSKDVKGELVQGGAEQYFVARGNLDNIERLGPVKSAKE